MLRRRTRGAHEPIVHRGRRALAAAAVVIATVLVTVLDPAGVRSYAADYLGPLRAPGEPGFIAGHRGDRSSAPENTMPAFESAFASGLAFVETDVRLSADGHPVLIHDDTVDRTTNGSGKVADMTLEELRRLDAGGWFGRKFAGTPIPTLGEFLDLLAAQPQGRALLELKGRWSADQLQRLLFDVYIRGVQDRVVIASFSTTTLQNARRADPAIPRIVLCRDLPDDPIRFAAQVEAIAVLTRVEAVRARPGVVQQLHDAGYGVMLYTLNSHTGWGEALGFGVDGIVTDRPSALDEWIARTAPGT